MTEDAERTGGIGHVLGAVVNAVTDPRGPVNTGAGTQFYIHTATIGTTEPPPPPRSPRLIAESMLQDLRRRFVEPPAFGRARQLLREPGTVLLTAASGSGRRTAALMLLHSSGDGANRFRELPDEVSDQPVVKLDAGALEPGERLLLDLSDQPEGQLGQLRRELVAYHSAVLGCGAYWVVILPERAEHGPPEDLRHLVVPIGRPDGGAVLRRHLAAHDMHPPSQLDVPGLASHLESDPMRELAGLARLVAETREAAEGAGTVREWMAQTVEALAAPVNAVADQVRKDSDGRSRALLLTAAMFERMPAEVVHEAAEGLLTVLKFPADDVHGLEQPDLTERLERIGARTDGERRVRFGTVIYGSAVRVHFWDSFPGLRLGLRDWLDKALRTHLISDRQRSVVLARFTEQSLRTRHAEDLFWLVEQLSRAGPPLLVAAAETLAQGLTDERHGAVFRRQVYLWVTSRGLSRNLAVELVRLCAEAIAPTRPEQALVRLRHLTRHPDLDVSLLARETLIALAVEDRRFRHRVLNRLAGDLDRPQPLATDLELFAALADPAHLSGMRAELVAGWRGVLAGSPHRQWSPPVRNWLAAHHDGTAGDAVLDVLVEAATGSSAVLARLYVVARDWAAEDSSRRRTAADLARRCDLASGTRTSRHTTEGVLR